MRLIKPFNKNWLFIAEQVDMDVADCAFESITLPHTNKLFLERFVDNRAYQFVSTYRKRFTLADVADKQVFIRFDGSMLETTVYLNDVQLGIHQGGYTPFRYDLTDYLVDGENVLTVYVDATEQKHIPPYGGQVDYLTFGGIYRDVYLEILNPCHFTKVFPKPLDVLTAPHVECEIQLSQPTPNVQLNGVIETSDGDMIAEGSTRVESEMLTMSFLDLPDVDLWTLDRPTLYTLKLSLMEDDTIIDHYMVRFGFREAEFRTDGSFYLNGEPLKLFGLNRHQTYPYIGAAAPKRLQELDADIIKYELGCNIVRTSHYAQSPYFLNRCDEIGLLMFEEMAGWQYIGGEAWQALAIEDLQAMIERDYHHPSIILWGVRFNETPDNEPFYTQTNAIAHDLDPTRQTGGVRDFLQSQFLEDVFTLNDFTEGIQTPRIPHLITEFVGHMFPTKTWDHEARRVEHALKHARKHNLQFGHPDVAGAIAWCAFDYYTHSQFGSGDRICHHGVMDLFRLPKFAAYFYRSQKSPDDEIVLHAATNWTMGDRDGGGNNPLVVFGNVERIEVWIGDAYQGSFEPDHQAYPHLPHPPFVIRWPEPYNPWGTEFLDLKVVGYIGDMQVAEHKISSEHVPDYLHISCHTQELKADGSDMARVVVQILDKYGNVLPYQMPIVTWTLEGDATMIGENPMALSGGQGACFVKAGHTSGQVRIQASTPMFTSQILKLEIVDEIASE